MSTPVSAAFGAPAAAPIPDDRLLVLFDADCGICTRSASILHRLDRARRLHVVPLQRGPSLPDMLPEAVLSDAMHVRDSAGRWSAGGAAVIRISREVGVLRPLAVAARLPGVPSLVDAGYRFVARHRQRISRLLGEDACRI